jgi:transcriptional regulator with XRE-family HTH domain
MNAASAVLDITPRQALDSLQTGLGLSDEDLAGALGISARTLQRWRANTAYPQQVARRRLAALLSLQERVKGAFKSTDVQRWSHAESRYLGGITPAEAIRAGRVDRVEAALEALDSGIFL